MLKEDHHQAMIHALVPNPNRDNATTDTMIVGRLQISNTNTMISTMVHMQILGEGSCPRTEPSMGIDKASTLVTAHRMVNKLNFTMAMQTMMHVRAKVRVLQITTTLVHPLTSSIHRVRHLKTPIVVETARLCHNFNL